MSTEKNEASTLLPNRGDTMTSREIAEITGKRHTEVLRSIRSMESAWENVSGRKFALADYFDSQSKPRPMYQLTKTECLYVATKFNDEARAKLVIRWEQLETSRNNQVDYLANALAKLADSVATIATTLNERLTRLENQALPVAGNIKIDRPAPEKPDYVDARNQAYDFVKVNHYNIRRITIDESVYYSINDFCNAISANTGAWQIAQKLNKQRPTALKIWIFGNTHPAWFTNKSGIRLIVSGSRTLRDDKNTKLELRRALA